MDVEHSVCGGRCRVAEGDCEVPLVARTLCGRRAAGSVNRFLKTGVQAGTVVKPSATRDVSDAWVAFEGEVLPHADRLFRLAMWFVRNRADAEDVVQDTMMQALHSFHRFQPGTNCRAWLSTILQRVVSNRRRAAGRSIVVERC